MTDHAHPAFVEIVRCMLVNPRRNIGRAITRLEAEKYPSGKKEWTALDYAREALEAIENVESIVHAEENRHVHTCSCGDTHYVKGEQDASS